MTDDTRAHLEQWQQWPADAAVRSAIGTATELCRVEEVES